MQDDLQIAGAEHYTPPNKTLLLEELSLSILSMYIMNRRGERKKPRRGPTLTLKGFVLCH